MSRMGKVIAVIVVLAVLVCIELWRSNRTIDREIITVTRSDIPAGFDGFRIAHISDLHSAQFGEDNAKLVALIAEEQPDIIVITGDVVDKPWDDLDALERTAKALAAVAPTYYVPGNHEYKRAEGESANISDVVFHLKSAGVTVLQNQAVELERNGDFITLLGIDDPNGRADQIPMEDAVRLAHEHYQSDFVLMLNHRYSRAEEASACGVQMMLAGHAHGGLIRLPFTDGVIGPSLVWFPKHTNGLYDIDGMSLVTSRGLGNAGWTRRLFNHPHLPIIELHTK